MFCHICASYQKDTSRVCENGNVELTCQGCGYITCFINGKTVIAKPDTREIISMEKVETA